MLLICQNIVLVSDFTEPLNMTLLPQLDYTAPEYALSGSISPAADMFSFGMVAYSVFTRSALFYANV